MHSRSPCATPNVRLRAQDWIGADGSQRQTTGTAAAVRRRDPPLQSTTAAGPLHSEGRLEGTHLNSQPNT